MFPGFASFLHHLPVLFLQPLGSSFESFLLCSFFSVMFFSTSCTQSVSRTHIHAHAHIHTHTRTPPPVIIHFEALRWLRASHKVPSGQTSGHQSHKQRPVTRPERNTPSTIKTSPDKLQSFQRACRTLGRPNLPEYSVFSKQRQQLLSLIV